MINRREYKKIIKEVLRKQDFYTPNYDNDSILNERDFYPPSDNRVWKSYVEDIEGGDNFADYCRGFFNMCEEEDYYE